MLNLPQSIVEDMAEVSPSAFLAYVYLSSRMSEDFTLRASNKSISEATGISYSYVSVAKKELSEMGWIAIDEEGLIRLKKGYDSCKDEIAIIANGALQDCDNHTEIKLDALPLYIYKYIYNYIYNNKYINNKYNNSFKGNFGGKTMATKKGKRLSDDFIVTPEMREWAVSRKLTVDIEIETEKFINYFQAAPGQKGVKLDWIATWRNWMLNAEGYQKGRNNYGRTQEAPKGNREKLAGYGAIFAKYESSQEDSD